MDVKYGDGKSKTLPLEARPSKKDLGSQGGRNLPKEVSKSSPRRRQ